MLVVGGGGRCRRFRRVCRHDDGIVGDHHILADGADVRRGRKAGRPQAPRGGKGMTGQLMDAFFEVGEPVH